MSEPQIYNAADEALKAENAFLKNYTPQAERIEERDAIWNFENIPNAMQEQTDLRGWMLKQKDARLELVRSWARQIPKQEGEDPTALGIRRAKLRRRFLFVIATEASHGLGSREVAAEAFKAVFPKE